MIRRIALHNVGVFKNAKVPTNLKRIVLIYAENASGKTTLAEVLRSLETSNPSILVKRHSFETRNDQHVVLECNGDPSKVIFQNRRWNEKRPFVKVFDEAFVDSNVYSGLSVDPDHRRNLYYLALGEQSVRLSRRREILGKEIIQYNKNMREAEKAVPADQRHDIPMDEFCSIKEVHNIKNEIEKARQDLVAISNASIILNTEKFQNVILPTFDASAIRMILQRGIQDLDAEAAARIDNHTESLGHNGESWIAQGMEYVSDSTKVCPFCGQDATNSSLIGHYRAYFSDAYANLKHSIKHMINAVRSIHSNDAQTTFERIVGANNANGHIWADYGLAMPSIDTKTIIQDWTSALNTVLEALEAKQAAPLESVALNSSVLASYEQQRLLITNINTTLNAYNEKIEEKKKMVNTTNVQSVCNRLHQLEIAERRYSPTMASWCDKYLLAKSAKNNANTEKIQITKQLNEYRKNAFPDIQREVNMYLQHFGVRFTMDNLKPINIGTGSTCTYAILVDNTHVSTSTSKSEDDHPSFAETLSTSDRNTLALALFLSSLEKNENLANTTVVIDDPISSFDENRSMATVQEIRKLATRAGQIIILSHKMTFLQKICRGLDQNNIQSFTITHSASGSDIHDWEIDQPFNIEQMRRQILLETYVRDQTGNHRDVIEAIRSYMEAVLEISCAGHYNANKPVGTFLSECRDKYGTVNEILDEATVVELQDIYEYSNPSKHGSHIDPEIGNINSKELLNYAKRLLNVTRLSIDKRSQTNVENGPN